MEEEKKSVDDAIVGSSWFCNSTCGKSIIGIVVTQSKFGKQKAYIGLGFGVSLDTDEKLIAKWGSTFPIELAKKLIGK